LISVRRNVFETNSSSTHSLCICTENEYEKFKNGDMMYDDYNEELQFVSDKELEEYKYRYKSYDSMGEWLEFYEEHFTTPSGDKMVAFGEFGYDG